MTWRLLIFSAAFAFASAQGSYAFAKPPEEEAAERAERAAERAAKAAERASEAAERAAERDARDHNERSGQDRTDSKDTDRDRNDSQDKQEAANEARSGDGEGVLKVDLTLSDSSDDSDGGGETTSADNNEDDNDTSGDGDLGDKADGEGSGSGSNSGSQEDLSDDSSGSNSGSGSSGSSDDEDDDHSGSGSSGDDGDEDEDDNKRDQVAMIVPLENDDGGNPFREGELVVMSDDNALLNRAEALGFSVIESRPLESIGALVARLRRPEGVSSNEALAMLRTREPGSPSGYNYIYRATGNAPETPEEDRPEPQHAAKTNVKVGVIDGFSADTVSGWTVERLVEKPAKTGHGDAVTGILLRDLETGYRVSPDKMMLLDVMREHPGGGAADVAALVFAFDKLVTAKVDVANLSLAGPDHPALRMAVTKSIQKGLVVVAAVGNGGPAAPPAFPAAYDGVVGVAAVDATGKPYIYSGRGPHVDIAALGVEVDASGTGGELAGTSYAAPHVSALLASLSHGGKTPSLDRLLVEYAEDVGAPGRDPIYGVGILMPDKAARVAMASEGSPSR